MVNLSSTSLEAAFPYVSLKCGSEARRKTASATFSGEEGGTKIPVTPSKQTSGSPPIVVVKGVFSDKRLVGKLEKSLHGRYLKE